MLATHFANKSRKPNGGRLCCIPVCRATLLGPSRGGIRPHRFGLTCPFDNSVEFNLRIIEGRSSGWFTLRDSWCNKNCFRICPTYVRIHSLSAFEVSWLSGCHFRDVYYSLPSWNVPSLGSGTLHPFTSFWKRRCSTHWILETHGAHHCVDFWCLSGHHKVGKAQLAYQVTLFTLGSSLGTLAIASSSPFTKAISHFGKARTT